MRMSRNDLCWCGSGLKWKKCHYPVVGGDGVEELYLRDYGIVLKTEEQIEGIRDASRVAASILAEVSGQVRVGVSTQELDEYARELFLKYGARSGALNYGEPPFPGSICTSVNDVIVHGIPGEYRLKEGDIIGIDVCAFVGDYCGDCCGMAMVGKVDEEKQRVVEVAKECLMRGIEVLGPGVMLREVGRVIQEYAELMGCSVVRELAGHGVGIKMHEPPDVFHYRNDSEIMCVEGMVFTVEPMINAGKKEWYLEKDGWTLRTIDGKPSAQWEHTVAIRKSGAEILTLAV